MNFRSVADLNAQIVAWSRLLPDDIEVVVGVPRSGMLAATLLALHRQLPLTDLDGFLKGHVFDGGRRFRAAFGEGASAAYLTRPRTVLLVDDSIRTGESLRQVRQRVAEAGLPHRVRYGVVYAEPGTEGLVDHFCETVPTPRAFEWNLLHTDALLGKCCVDIDGVLCPDPTAEQNDDGPAYEDFLANAPQLYRPTGEIGWLVTCRLEKHRAATEAWLATHGIRYRELVMMDHPDAAARRAAKDYGEFKAAVYEASGAHFFLESNPVQAEEIARRTGRAVYCVGTRRLVEPGPLARSRRAGGQRLSRLWFRARRKTRKVLARLLGSGLPDGGDRGAATEG